MIKSSGFKRVFVYGSDCDDEFRDNMVVFDEGLGRGGFINNRDGFYSGNGTVKDFPLNRYLEDRELGRGDNPWFVIEK